MATAAITGWALIGRCVDVCTTKPEMADLDMHTLGAEMLSSERGGMLLPFEAISVLLLACIIGAVVVARKR